MSLVNPYDLPDKQPKKVDYGRWTNNLFIRDDGEFFVLWGGPVKVQADQVRPDDAAELRAHSSTLQTFYAREGDDGPIWCKEMRFYGVEVTAVSLDEDQRAHVRLGEGTWIVIEGDGTDLVEHGLIFGLYIDNGDWNRLEDEDRRWNFLPARAISIIRGD